MGRMRKGLLALCICLWISSSFSGLAKVPEENVLREEELYSKACVLMDAKSKRVLFGKNQDEVLAMASTTKIMTCIIALECADLSEFVEVSAYAQSMPKVKMGIKKGEIYILEDLLYSMMLESNNDAAVAIAEHVGKKYLPEGGKNSSYTQAESKQAVAAFSRLMNEKAKEIGCRNTYFITPNGLDAEEVSLSEEGELTKEHSTTATDLAKILSYCILESEKKEEYIRITRTTNRYLSSQKGRGFTCTNTNAFLGMMDGVITGKTGFTNKAGYCYVGALERDGKVFVVALLGCGWPGDKTYKWKDAKKLLNYGLSNYTNFSFDRVLLSEEKLGSVGVFMGQSKDIGVPVYVKAKIDGRIIEEEENGEEILLKKEERIDVVYTMKKYVRAPVYQGQEIGRITYKIGDIVYKEERIVLGETVEAIDLSWSMEMVLKIFFCLLL